VVPPRFRLCLLLTRSGCVLPPEEVLTRAIAGGVDLVQVREKDAAGAELLTWTRQVVSLGRAAGVPVVVNDALDLALAADADGVHLGQEDLHPDEARALLGPDRLIGLSTHDLEQVDEAADLGVDYVGFGPVFATATKGYTRGLGTEALIHACAVARLPVLAIGGIHVENRWLLGENVGVAVSSALCSAEDPQKVARALSLCPV
jgi:thiamine-phosphate pyrophosphorylase